MKVKKREKRRAMRKVRMLMSCYEEKLNTNLYEITSRSGKVARTKFQSAKDTAEDVLVRTSKCVFVFCLLVF